MDDTVNITGGKQLAEFLQTLPLKLERNIMRAALRAGARVIANEAKLNVPVQDGDLKRSIRTGSNAKKGRVEAYAKAGDKKAWYYRFVEFGTAAHIIKGKNGNMLKFTSRDGKSIAVPQVSHTGAIAKPYMRPALDTKGDEAVVAVTNKIRERLTKEGINTPAPEGSGL
jgi:HK97 gp10 family phage protein